MSVEGKRLTRDLMAARLAAEFEDVHATVRGGA